MTAESVEWVPPKTSEEEAVEKARKTIIIESRRWLEVSWCVDLIFIKKAN